MWIEDTSGKVPDAILAEHEASLAALVGGDRREALGLLKAHRQRSEVFLATLADV